MKKLLQLWCMVLIILFQSAGQGVYAGTPEPQLSGKVVETMNSGSYTYVCLEKDNFITWVAVREMKITVGQEISFYPGAEMRDFESKTLKRKFDKIIFSAGPISQPGTESAAKPTDGEKSVVTMAEKAEETKVSGPNTFTIAEIYEKKDTLDKQDVVVKGKVVKVSAAIMKRNWVHLRDGSGNQETGTHDLVVTSQDLPAVGEVVTVSGTLAKDRDFGAGYKFTVIMEKAKIGHYPDLH